jgi:alpha-galactosidase
MKTRVNEDMFQSRAWTSRLFSNPAEVPIAFTLNGKPVRGIPANWNPTSRKRRLDANMVETVFEGREPKSGLKVRVECVEYFDYPVVEWTAWFTNEERKTTPILSDILALDATFEGASPVLNHCNGDSNSAEGYTVQNTPVRRGKSLRFAPGDGRPCDQAFPYYRLMFKGRGLSLAIGWPAQWSAEFKGVANGARIKAGQEKTRLRLMPGETIRTPRITVMSWTGDAERAANLWRRWYRDHLLPRPDGRPLGPRLVGHGTDGGDEHTRSTEANQVRFIKTWARRGIPIDTWWIDAGWYPCFCKERLKLRWWLTGTWKPDPERFPNGFKPVSDCAARHGADLLLWFEPERVMPGRELDLKHPEWLLKVKGKDIRLLNLGIPACRQWLTDHVCNMIRDNGIRIYRQDFNLSPLEHWRLNDKADRQGMSENLHVQGYLQYWDDLLARNPGLWIDSCASGGRRNDLETMRRSVPLHYSDFGYGNHPVKLSFHHVMFQWLPYFKEVTLSWDLQGKPERFDRVEDSFSYHCGLGPMMIPCIDIRRDDYDFALIKTMLAIWRRAADLMLRGDYHPLTPIHRTARKWVARQFDCPEEGVGFIQGIRLPLAPEKKLTVRPRTFRPEATYLFENQESGEKRELSGRALLRDGFTFVLPKREGAIWFYHVKAGKSEHSIRRAR